MFDTSVLCCILYLLIFKGYVMPQASKLKKKKLKRSLSLFLIVFYGLGTILGAGIYALIGKVAKHADMSAPWAFLLASFIAFFTAMSYAQLSQKYPVSGAEAFYVQKAFNKKWLSIITGWLIVITACISCAALANGFSGYLQTFFSIADWITIIAIIGIIALIAFWGITESAILSAVITLIEIAGLIFVMYVCSEKVMTFNKWHTLIPEMSVTHLSGLIAGSFIAFYAFIGFEDMVNVAEEVKNPKKNMPIAILIVMLIVTAVYLLISICVISAVPIAQLAQSKAPFATVFQQQGYSTNIISGISLVAMVNGILLQIVMASRVLYGLANQHKAPKILGSVHSLNQTPHIATLAVALVVISMALLLPIETLAQATSSVLVCVFVLVNASLLYLKHKERDYNVMGFNSILFPIIGLLLTSLFLLAQFFV